MQRLVVCAAIRGTPGSARPGVVVCGARHGDCLNAAGQYGIKNAGLNPDGTRPWECGFVDQHNEFMTRAEAWKVADAAGQIRRPKGFERHYDDWREAGVGDEGLLFSENLY